MIGWQKWMKGVGMACPTCRGPVPSIRNLGMEKIAASLQFPCKFAHSGCGQYFFHHEKVEHEEICEYRLYQCPCPGASCRWQGSLNDVMENHLYARDVRDGHQPNAAGHQLRHRHDHPEEFAKGGDDVIGERGDGMDGRKRPTKQPTNRPTNSPFLLMSSLPFAPLPILSSALNMSE